MSKKELLIIADYSEETLLTLEELSSICGIQVAIIHEFISHDIIKSVARERLMFDMKQLHRMQQALRLQRDLELNLAGAALVLDLLEEMQRLQRQTELLEKHFAPTGEANKR